MILAGVKYNFCGTREECTQRFAGCIFMPKFTIKNENAEAHI
ncbi:hypothetical protein C823_006147 [Eubacterium plexicaudatum ASF492]|nr:hypothetical protein C823_006147 [Eubacterium plexicaudatum ASF492]